MISHTSIIIYGIIPEKEPSVKRQNGTSNVPFKFMPDNLSAADFIVQLGKDQVINVAVRRGAVKSCHVMSSSLKFTTQPVYARRGAICQKNAPAEILPGRLQERGEAQLPIPVMASMASYCCESRLFFIPSPSTMSRSTILPPCEQMTRFVLPSASAITA